MPLFETPELQEDELHVLSAIDELKSQLGYAIGASPKRWTGLLRRNTFARAIQGSNSIEGYHVSVEDAVAAVEAEEPFDTETETWRAVLGYRSALTYVMQLAGDPLFRLTPELIKSLHFMMLEYDLSKNPGRWRPGIVYVRAEATGEIVYEGPPAEHVPPLIDELITSLSQTDSPPPTINAAMCHLNFVMIHPFSDGNGRIARCLQTLILARNGSLSPVFSSIEEYLGRNTTDYYEVLARVGQGSWNPDRDARPWIRFCLTAHYRQATTLMRRLREYEKLWDRLEQLLKRTGLPERLALALSDAAMGLRVRNATYRSAAGVSNQVATLDLKAAVEHGLLTAHGERRGRYYLAAGVLKDTRAAVAEPKGIGDPFAELARRTQLSLELTP